MLDPTKEFINELRRDSYVRGKEIASEHFDGVMSGAKKRPKNPSEAPKIRENTKID